MKILVTGGNGGIGSKVVDVLREQYDGLDIFTLGDKNCDYIADYSSPYQFEEYIQGNAKQFNNVEMVVHCVGKNKIAPHRNIAVSDMLDLFCINALGDYILTSALSRQRLRWSCHVISDAAWTPMTHSIAYNTSKAAQLMVMRQLAHEINPTKTIIFGVSPGKVSGTNMSNYIDQTFPGLRGMTFNEGREYQKSRLRTGEQLPIVVARLIGNLLRNCTMHMHGHNYPIGG